MGARDMNFHKQVFARMGYEREADRIQDLFLEGRRQEAVRAVPRSMAADISLVGPVAHIRDELAMWEEAGVTMLVVGARGPRRCAPWRTPSSAPESPLVVVDAR